jgi:hypothetical protein
MRNAYDYYPTPSWCYEQLPIDFSMFNTAHEPCAGDKRIVNFLTSKGVNTTYTEIQEGSDFFDWDDNVDLILTNPPYSYAQEFIEYSIPRASCVIMLLRINFLGAQKRFNWWIKNEPDALIVLSNRPSFTGTGTDATEYAWYVWQQETYIPKGIHHIKK